MSDAKCEICGGPPDSYPLAMCGQPNGELGCGEHAWICESCVFDETPGAATRQEVACERWYERHACPEEKR